VVASTPETAWGLSAVYTRMSKLLAVVALRKVILGFVSLHYDTTKGYQVKDILVFIRFW
jgi:hypothetical protein